MTASGRQNLNYRYYVATHKTIIINHLKRRSKLNLASLKITRQSKKTNITNDTLLRL